MLDFYVIEFVRQKLADVLLGLTGRLIYPYDYE